MTPSHRSAHEDDEKMQVAGIEAEATGDHEFRVEPQADRESADSLCSGSSSTNALEQEREDPGGAGPVGVEEGAGVPVSAPVSVPGGAGPVGVEESDRRFRGQKLQAPVVPSPVSRESKIGESQTDDKRIGVTERSASRPAGVLPESAPRRKPPFGSETIIGDPGELSTYIPTALSEPFGRPDSIIDAGMIGDLQLRAASLRGHGHRYSSEAFSTTRQDAYFLRLTVDQKWLVIVVADGVSNSTLQSHRAAEVAARTGTRLIVDELESGIHPTGIQWKEKVHHRLSSDIIKIIAREEGRVLPPDGKIDNRQIAQLATKMATTAVVAIVGTQLQAGKIPYYAVALAGDSSVLMLSQGKWTSVVGGKRSPIGAVQSAVRGLPIPAGDGISAKEGLLSPGEALFVMTDGVTDPLGSGQGDVGRLFAARWAHVPEKWSFARDLDFHKRSFDDDRTVVGVWPE